MSGHSGQDGSRGVGAKPERERRLAEALRANLKRRKVQRREQAAAGDAGGDAKSKQPGQSKSTKESD